MPARGAARRPENPLRLALKAEALLGLHLVTRHRAPRLAAALGLALGAASAASGSGATGARSVLLIASTVAVVGASRLLAPGPALAAARMVAARWWVVPVGRLAGALSAVGPFALGIAGLVLGPHQSGFWRVAWIAGGYAVVLMACTMALVPGLGASAAATLAFVMVWLGGVPPSAVSAVLQPWPVVQGFGVWVWDLLPLPWRAMRWLGGGPVADPLLLMAWAAVGVALTGWQVSVPSGERASARRLR